MLQNADALTLLSKVDQAEFKRVARKSLEKPGTFVKIDPEVWHRVQSAMADACHDRLLRLIDQERSIEQDSLRLRIR